MHTAIDLITATYPAWEGAKALDLLCHYPGEPIYATILERCMNEGISPRVAQHKLYHLAPIPMTDPVTMKAVDKRINQLLAALAIDQSPAGVGDCLGSPALSQYLGACLGSPEQAELSALIAYRRETTLPTGGIKCFGDEDTKAYRRIWAAIYRLLKKAEKDGHHEAVAIVKAHLKQGKMFCWEKE